MATLSLPASRKKPAAAPIPSPVHPFPNDLVGKFAVVHKHSSMGKSMRFTKPHDTIDIARAEGRRLMAESPGKRFVLIQVLEEVTL